MSETVETEVVDEGPGLYEIFLKGEYDQEYMHDIFGLIHKLPPDSNLMIWTNSNGGSMHVGMMLKEKLESKNLNVTFISHLFNASMGCIMPQIGDFIRLTYPSSVFTFHEPALRSVGIAEVHNNLIEYSTGTIEIVKSLMQLKVGLTNKEFKRFWGVDKIFFGHQLLNVGEDGFVDGLILKELGVGIFLVKTREGNKVIDVSKHKRADIKDLPVVAE